jgi:Transposase C of IS166 homeodomain/zinc-finger binding domain of transposase IS66
LPEDPALLQHMLREAQAEITRLQMLIAVLLRNRFGRRSERLGEDALQQGVEDIEQSLAEQQAKLEAAQPAADWPAKPPRRNRGSLPEHLPRVEVVVDIADKICGCCGAPPHAIGEDRSETLDYVPAQIRVQVSRRPRYGCRARLPKVPSAKPMELQTRTAKALCAGTRGAAGARAGQQICRPPCATNTPTTMEEWNYVRDEGWPLGIRDQERVPNHRELLS